MRERLKGAAQPIGEKARRIQVGSLGALPDVPFNVRALARAGVVKPMRPDLALHVARELRRWGASPAAGVTMCALRYPDEPMIIDEAGTLTFSEVQSRTNRLARALRNAGVRSGDGVAIMARNHRGFVESVLALAKLGASAR